LLHFSILLCGTYHEHFLQGLLFFFFFLLCHFTNYEFFSIFLVVPFAKDIPAVFVISNNPPRTSFFFFGPATLAVFSKIPSGNFPAFPPHFPHTTKKADGHNELVVIYIPLPSFFSFSLYDNHSFSSPLPPPPLLFFFFVFLFFSLIEWKAWKMVRMRIPPQRIFLM